MSRHHPLRLFLVGAAGFEPATFPIRPLADRDARERLEKFQMRELTTDQAAYILTAFQLFQLQFPFHGL